MATRIKKLPLMAEPMVPPIPLTPSNFEATKVEMATAITTAITMVECPKVEECEEWKTCQSLPRPLEAASR